MFLSFPNLSGANHKKSAKKAACISRFLGFLSSLAYPSPCTWTYLCREKVRRRALLWERNPQVESGMWAPFHSEGINGSIVYRAHFTLMDGFHGTELELSHRQKTIYVKGGRIKHRQPIESQSQALTGVAKSNWSHHFTPERNFLWRSWGMHYQNKLDPELRVSELQNLLCWKKKCFPFRQLFCTKRDYSRYLI